MENQLKKYYDVNAELKTLNQTKDEEKSALQLRVFNLLDQQRILVTQLKSQNETASSDTLRLQTEVSELT